MVEPRSSRPWSAERYTTRPETLPCEVGGEPSATDDPSRSTLSVPQSASWSDRPGAGVWTDWPRTVRFVIDVSEKTAAAPAETAALSEPTVISPPKIEMPENSALAYARPVLASADALTDCEPVETMK